MNYTKKAEEYIRSNILPFQSKEREMCEEGVRKFASHLDQLKQPEKPQEKTGSYLDGLPLREKIEKLDRTKCEHWHILSAGGLMGWLDCGVGDIELREFKRNNSNKVLDKLDEIIDRLNQ